MSSTPFMQLYVGDYLADTLDLTTEQHGAYLLLLLTMWQHDAKLPNDPVKLARIARMTPAKFRKVWEEIGRFFDDDGDTISNARLTKERKKAIEKSVKRAAAGSAGGHAKALKDKGTDVAKATRLPWHLPDTRDYIRDDVNTSSCAGADAGIVQKPIPFDEFWSSWPLSKVGKDASKRAWSRLSPDQRRLAKERAAEWCRSWRAANPRLNDIHPATYLNNKRWEDEAPPFAHASPQVVPIDNAASIQRALARLQAEDERKKAAMQ